MLVLLVALHAQVPTPHPTVGVCPPAAAAAVDSGWRAYRTGALGPGLTHVATAPAPCPAEAEPENRIGLMQLRLGSDSEAARLFHQTHKEVAAIDSAR